MMTNGVTVSSFLSYRSAIMGYVHMLGFALSRSWSGVTSTLISLVVLMSISTTAQDRGGTFMFLFSDTDDVLFSTENYWSLQVFTHDECLVEDFTIHVNFAFGSTPYP